MEASTDDINEEDKALFKNTIAKESPIDKDAISIPRNINYNKHYTIKKKDNLEGSFSASQYISYAKSGVSPKILKHMKKGLAENDVPVLDLHHKTVEQAYKLLTQFINHHQNKRFIRIIHGKGYNSDTKISVLKLQTFHYLKQHPFILAFNSCPPKFGGTGSVFALLKTNKQYY